MDKIKVMTLTLEVDLEQEYMKEFDLEHTRYDASRSEYGAIFHTNEPNKKDSVSFYATYYNDDELYDTYREEIWSRDLRKAFLTKEAQNEYGDNFLSVEVSSSPELFIDDINRKNVPRYIELSEKSMKNGQVIVMGSEVYRCGITM